MGSFGEMLSFIIRLVEPAIAAVIVIMCFVSLKGSRRQEHALIVLEDDELKLTYPVLYWENSIGRSKSSDICINDPTVSRDHAVLLRRNDGWFITDTGSKAGVTVNNEAALFSSVALITKQKLFINGFRLA